MAIYAVSLLGGSAGALLLSPDALTAGASGALFGLTGAAACAMWRRGASLGQIPWLPIIVVDLLYTLAMPGISIGGHLGGLVVGGVAGAVVFDPRSRSRVASVVVVAVLRSASLGVSSMTVHGEYGSCEGNVTIGYHCDAQVPLR